MILNRTFKIRIDNPVNTEPSPLPWNSQPTQPTQPIRMPFSNHNVRTDNRSNQQNQQQPNRQRPPRKSTPGPNRQNVS